MSFEFLFEPVEDLDAWITGFFEGAPLLPAASALLIVGVGCVLTARAVPGVV